MVSTKVYRSIHKICVNEHLTATVKRLANYVAKLSSKWFIISKRNRDYVIKASSNSEVINRKTTRILIKGSETTFVSKQRALTNEWFLSVRNESNLFESRITQK